MESYNVVSGVVINNVDPYGGNRIQVKLGNIHDGNVKDNELIYCTPLIPKLIHIIPKPGELVLVILQKNNSSKGNRFYIGPVLSQPQRYYHELNNTALSFLDNPDGGNNSTLPNPNNNLDNKGSIPEINDISFIGRDNCDITLKEHEIRLRCGYKENGNKDNNLKFNKIDPAFIQMQWERRFDDNTNLTDKKYSSSINIFADRINLLSRHSDINIGELDNYELITPDKMNELLSKCHPLVYGDKLIQFLENFRTAYLTHTHPFPMMPPVPDAKTNQIATIDFDSMLSKSVKTS
jgi:hypothetical protein